MQCKTAILGFFSLFLKIQFTTGHGIGQTQPGDDQCDDLYLLHSRCPSCVTESSVSKELVFTMNGLSGLYYYYYAYLLPIILVKDTFFFTQQSFPKKELHYLTVNIYQRQCWTLLIVTNFRPGPIWAWISPPKGKTERKTPREQAETEDSCSEGLAVHHQGRNPSSGDVCGFQTVIDCKKSATEY